MQEQVKKITLARKPAEQNAVGPLQVDEARKYSREVSTLESFRSQFLVPEGAFQRSGNRASRNRYFLACLVWHITHCCSRSEFELLANLKTIGRIKGC